LVLDISAAECGNPVEDDGDAEGSVGNVKKEKRETRKGKKGVGME